MRYSEKNISSARGFTLIEVIVLIIIVSILSAALFSAFGAALQGSPQVLNVSRVAELAQERTELILAQRRRTTFGNFTAANFDPCVPAAGQPPPCTAGVPNFSVSAALQTNWNGDANFKIITVSVNGPATFQLQTLVANY